VAKTSAGASEHLLVADVANLRQAIDALKEKGIWVVATDESGDLLYDEVDYRGATAIVIGGEGEGIRRLVLEGCDQVVRIPMAGQVSSLNAAAAGTVLLYEAVRQRGRDAPPAATRTPRPPDTADAAPEARPEEPQASEADRGMDEMDALAPASELEVSSDVEVPAPEKPKPARRRSTKKTAD
jgi:tRNA(Leu) C34 or U34 (ribose-2'-O)-methylase TrmL